MKLYHIYFLTSENLQIFTNMSLLVKSMSNRDVQAFPRSIIINRPNLDDYHLRLELKFDLINWEMVLSPGTIPFPGLRNRLWRMHQNEWTQRVQLWTSEDLPPDRRVFITIETVVWVNLDDGSSGWAADVVVSVVLVPEFLSVTDREWRGRTRDRARREKPNDRVQVKLENIKEDLLVHSAFLFVKVNFVLKTFS